VTAEAIDIGVRIFGAALGSGIIGALIGYAVGWHKASALHRELFAEYTKLLHAELEEFFS
jgi:hypothetical protein